ncbi:MULTISPECIES: WapI family immunity protein [unclassified Pseudoalteromonas]|uniref:WapI family immunity protein n=1 Tax=unclassified Pseudoalteromonas TaxID=194690 RepID=UPI001F2CB95B|nr:MULTISPECIES: hypothetical protein [unclassified Pseudoalteromonas]MCF2828033.1 hypothetical protein [Pseudoalteromonas sp. OF5H-5]MCF2830337.1 hypothetical protein [Pseudoalteromonas sp. DL2-H6]MCF2924184.1 hypothetical protein [Pseudoalteromonas sp. DL2-H1]
MKINLSDSHKLEIVVLSRGADEYDYDYNLRLTLSSSGFTFTKDVWADGSEVQEFIKNIESLKSTLKGEAKLISESPDELELLIKPVDALGHFVLKIELGNQFMIGKEWFWSKYIDAFSLEAAALELVCDELLENLV